MVEAKNNLAGLYFEEENYEKAIKNYDEAIADGCKVAIENQGDLYEKIGDIEKAISYYQRSSNTVSCQIKLGDIFRKIDNIDESIIWYKKAFESGDVHSAYTLGLIYEQLKDFENAKKYFSYAVEHNHVNSRIHLGKIYYNEGDFEKSKEMFEITANENNIYSQHMIGLIYEIYYKDYTNAKYWYEKSKEQGCIESIYNLGQLSLKLDEIEESKKYFLEGSAKEDKNCEYMLAYLYYEKSRSMFKNLSDLHYENSESIYNLMEELNVNKEERLVAPFEEMKEKEEEEYIPQYILDVNENLENEFEPIEKEMKIEI